MMDRRLVCGLVVLSLAFCLARASSIRGAISPSTPSAFNNQRISLTCRLDGNITDDISAQDIFFRSTNPDIQLASVPRIIDDRTVSLAIPKVSLNVSLSKISCHLGNAILDEVTIFVENEPRFPNDTKCVVYNWESMVCSWEWEEVDNISISMAYSRSRFRNHKYACPNPRRVPEGGSCAWEPFDGPNMFFYIDHYLWFKATNAYNAVAFSKRMTARVDCIVKPDPVRIDQVNVTHDGISLDLTLHWSLKRVMFRVAYESPSAGISIRNTTETSITLSNLVPNTKYTITIDCIPLVRGIATGFWSDKQTVEVTTKPDVPDSNRPTSVPLIVVDI